MCLTPQEICQFFGQEMFTDLSRSVKCDHKVGKVTGQLKFGGSMQDTRALS